MNLLAFILVMVAGVIGLVILLTQGWKQLVGWALVLLAAGVIIQEVFIDWSHTVHS